MNLKAMTSALAVAALAASVFASAPASAQRAARHYAPQSTVAPQFSPYSDGTGTVPDWQRDRHDDR